MNAQRMYKEARPLFWPWCAVVCAGALPLLHPPYPLGEISRVGFVLGIPLLAALPFGIEFQNRTFSLLLSQPISRMEIWREKLSITAIVVFTAALLFLASLGASGAHAGREFWWYAAGAAIVFAASAPFWTLATRSIIGGVVLSFGIYNFIIVLGNMAIFWLMGSAKVAAPNFIAIMSCVFFVYGVLTLWLGWRNLARFQAIGDMAGDDLLATVPNVLPGVLVNWLRCRPSGAVLNLIRKEFRLLRPVWLISMLAAAGWACLAGLALLTPRGLSRDFYAVVAGIGVISTLMIAALAGSLSLGEERTSGTHSWHLTLPVPARSQWFIKLCMALFAGFAGAWLLPVLIAGRSVLRSSNFWDGTYFGSTFLIVVLLLTFTAFWCACAVKGTVPAVLWIVPVMVAIYFAGEFGDWSGEALTNLFFSRFDPFDNVKLAHAVSCFGSTAFFRPIFSASRNMTDRVQVELVTAATLLVPTLLYAVIQSYRLFRAQPQDRAWSVMRRLAPLALVAFLCNFALPALEISVGRANLHQYPEFEALFQTIQAIENIKSGAPGLAASHPVQLTVDDLAKAFPLSKSTRRLLGDSHITLRLVEPGRGKLGCPENSARLSAPGYAWYSAIIPLADGSHFALALDPASHSTISAGICK